MCTTFKVDAKTFCNRKLDVRNTYLRYYFEVRCTEFTHSLCLGTLKNWKILVKYFTKILKNPKIRCSNQLQVTTGFLKLLTDHEKLKLLWFITDLGYLYSRFQTQLQADHVTIYDLDEKNMAFLNCIDNLKESSLICSWKETLNNSVIETKTFISNNCEINVKFKGFTLCGKTINNMRRKPHHLGVCHGSS